MSKQRITGDRPTYTAPIERYGKRTLAKGVELLEDTKVTGLNNGYRSCQGYICRCGSSPGMFAGVFWPDDGKTNTGPPSGSCAACASGSSACNSACQARYSSRRRGAANAAASCCSATVQSDASGGSSSSIRQRAKIVPPGSGSFR